MTHTQTSTNGQGPDYCDECSHAAQDWVKWPCAASRGGEPEPTSTSQPGPAVSRKRGTDPRASLGPEVVG